MARQKAILTTRQDFEQSELASNKSRAYIYFDGVNLPNDVSQVIDNDEVIEFRNGTPTVTNGIVGTNNATVFNKATLAWKNWQIPAHTSVSLSTWVKFTAADLTANTWRILATNRGFGLVDYGLHVGTLGGNLNVRVFGSGGSGQFYLPNTSPFYTLQPNVWYHIGVYHRAAQAGDNTFVVINGAVAHSARIVTGSFAAKEQNYSIGDMNANTGASNGNTGGTSSVATGETFFAYDDNAFTTTDLINLYGRVGLGERIDYVTEEGSIRQAQAPATGGYAPQVEWTSKVVDLGAKFKDFGLISAQGTIIEGTGITIQTRSSADNESFTNWAGLGEGGRIQSPNERYIQIKVTFTSDGTTTAVLDAIRFMEDDNPIEAIPLPTRVVNSAEPLYLYQDLSSGLKSLGQVRNAYDILIEEEINGEDILTFSLPLKDKKAKEIGIEPVELLAVLGDRYYIVKENLRKRDSDGKVFTHFICEARWTELRDWYCNEIEMVEATARQVMEAVFANIFREPNDPLFDWTLGNVEITRRRTLRSDWTDVLSLLHAIQAEWGGELLFDTKNKVVHLVEQIGRSTGVSFRFDKNIKTMERTIDTYDLVTRIYPTGKGELDITTINNGVSYLENTTWVDKLGLRRRIIPYKWKDERYTIPQNLYDDSIKMLEVMSKPRIKYIASIMDLSFVKGHEHEVIELGDTVVVEDDELFEERIINRVLRRKYDVRNPEKTDVEISEVSKTLADISKRAMDDAIANLIESDPLSNTDIQQMTVFNHLLNSRGEDGFSSWVEAANGTQFQIANAGFSGGWSYKVQPDYGKAASITQTVDGISHRSTYTVSAAVATEGKITRGSANDAFIGIKVLVYYEGEEEPEVHLLGIPDITAVEPEEEFDEGGSI